MTSLNEGTTLVLHANVRLRGGAQLGKAVKGQSKVVVKATSDGTDEDIRLHDSIQRMEMMDSMKRLALSKNQKLLDLKEQEEKISRLNMSKIQSQWRAVMRSLKVENLRKEVEIRSQQHERDLDRKDAAIQMLNRDLEEAEEQFQASLRSHLCHVDRLIALQDKRMTALERDFQRDLQYLSQGYALEKQNLINQHSIEKQELNRLMRAVEAQEREREAEARQEHEQLREEIRNKNSEEFNVLRIMLDSSIEELEQHFEAAHLTYLQNTDQRTQDFKYLKTKDQDLSRDIELKIRKIERIQSSIAAWRTKIAQLSKENGERNRGVEKERKVVAVHFQKLKAKMNTLRDRNRKQLAELSGKAHTTIATLDQQLELMERILSLGELVRKCETDSERITPFVDIDSEDYEEEADAATSSIRCATSEPILCGEDKIETRFQENRALVSHLNGQPVTEWNYLDNFWKRFNKVVLDELVLKRAKERLEMENKELQVVLKHYTDGTLVNSDVMNRANSLLIIKGNLNLFRSDTTKGGQSLHKPVVDGNHAVRTNGYISRLQD
uniref:Dynein regulatory complex subunit 2 n=1 Tax=Albugo laibachii Nc14 TaxID=890382 RepID=F0WYR9_9STRA|nr:conserved hypothetical protein [Albugo laibachii Nc14]|eukprot:CCA26628.1 conserved hypothetical protein [Albugo laibachii Nc14]